MKTRSISVPALAVLTLATVILSACGQSDGGAAAPAVATPVGDPVRTPAFEVALTFTPDAAAKLSGMDERVVIDAMFYGIAKDSSSAGDQTGQVDLGAKEIEVQAIDQTVSVSAPPFMPGPMSEITQEGARLLINVYSARRAAEDNLLACGIFDDGVGAIPETPIAIHCELIYPEAPSPAAPVAPPAE